MTRSTGFGAPAVLWQGFHHRWRYNHRVNRIGSYVEHKTRSGDSCEAELVHTAASGTGPDRADFTEVYTKIRAGGVGFQAGAREIKLATEEERLTNFNVLAEVALGSELAGKENHVVVLNGFDLVADEDPDKLMTLALEVTDPELDSNRTTLSFRIKGAFRVDCSSPECDNLVSQVSEAYGREWTKSIYMLDREFLATGGVSDRRDIDSEGEPTLIDNVAGPLAEKVYYTLRVYYLIVAGDKEDLCITLSPLIEHKYSWNRRDEVLSGKQGKRYLFSPDVIAGDNTRPYEGSTVAFKQIIMSVYRSTRRRRLLFWQRDIAMHLLEWNTAVSDIREFEPGIFTCAVDLFFRNWARGMKFAHLWQSLFAYRDAGQAQFGAQLVLLQFRHVDLCEQAHYSGSIHWPGGGRRAKGDPASTARYPVQIP